MSVSLCMIVRNEEVNLPACLDSAAGLANELIIIDTGSTDATKAIGRRRGAQVYDFPWCDDFAAARNESIRRAKGDWIFWLDADDRLDGENRARLESLFSSLPNTRDGYVMRCVCVGRGNIASHEVDHVRLFRNDALIRYRYRVHEQVAPAVRQAGGSLRKTDIAIQHTGYGDAVTYKRKQERNLRLLEMECHERPLDPFMLYYRGVALLDLERAAEALISLQLCNSLVPKATAIARLVPVHLAEAYTREGMRSDAAEVLRAAQATYPSDPDLGLATATVLYREGELAAAEAVLSSSSTASPGELHSDNFVGDPSVAAFRIRHLLAVIRYLQGRFQEAEEDARAVIDICPEFGEGWLLLADALLAQGKRQEHAIVGTTLSSIPGTEAARILISASARKRAGDLPGGLRLVEGGIGSHGEHPYLLRARDRLALGGPESWRGGAYFLSARDLPDLRR